MEQTMITISPFNVEGKDFVVKNIAGLPLTSRRYMVDKKSIEILQNFNEPKKGAIPVSELAKFTNTASDLEVVEVEYSLEDVAEKLGRINGLAATSPNNLFRNNAVSPEMLGKVFGKIIEDIEKEHVKKENDYKYINEQLEVKYKDQLAKKEEETEMLKNDQEELNSQIDEMKELLTKQNEIITNSNSKIKTQETKIQTLIDVVKGLKAELEKGSKRM